MMAHDQSVLTSQAIDNMAMISPCTHEEADSRMILHIAHCAKTGYAKIIVKTVDSDVLVLAVSTVSALHQQYEHLQVWVEFGTGKHFKYIAAHEMSTSLGPHKSLSLPMFHALTGCDTVSRFAWRGKKLLGKPGKCVHR